MTVIIRRAEWGARPWVGKRVVVPDAERTGVVVHHTTGTTLGREDSYDWVRKIDRYHQSRGWSSIGYHWLVDAAGRVFEGRGWEPAGAHCPGMNTSAWGIALLGDGDGDDGVLPADALEAIGELLGLAERRAGHPLALSGHRDHRQTACPGDALYAWAHDVDDHPAGGPPLATATAAADITTPPAPPAFPLEPGAFYGAGGVERGEGLRRWQSRMRQRGWKGRRADGTVDLIDVDGDWGPQTAGVTRAFQTEKGLLVDERVGKVTWAAAWTEPVT